MPDVDEIRLTTKNVEQLWEVWICPECGHVTDRLSGSESPRCGGAGHFPRARLMRSVEVVPADLLAIAVERLENLEEAVGRLGIAGAVGDAEDFDLARADALEFLDKIKET